MRRQSPRKKPADITISLHTLQERIQTIRGQRVIVDSDLAILYGVTTGRLNQQVRRNEDRFPRDFVFVLTPMEATNLKLHFATSSSGWGGRRKLPYVFTEHGVLMAANVLNSSIAIQASVHVVRAFRLTGGSVDSQRPDRKGHGPAGAVSGSRRDDWRDIRGSPRTSRARGSSTQSTNWIRFERIG